MGLSEKTCAVTAGDPNEVGKPNVHGPSPPDQLLSASVASPARSAMTSVGLLKPAGVRFVFWIDGASAETGGMATWRVPSAAVVPTATGSLAPGRGTRTRRLAIGWPVCRSVAHTSI